ncbi:non-ribosomal peptide synthetase [Dolichospermum sp. UHCC 0259]|uniref:non-ribosomal peptide synthetase n=1 Tax=Dolichospermum sp. UHCC 0259 TaxID=2590010 RepID=UPI001444D4CB|nr:non-ribosomal peptide synthetase [Dolichospermum sp. UHCC 0259]MTJ48119.1 amino acid adenylation domain-containing protein [Dolichospermum sp. UHCC 0259]
MSESDLLLQKKANLSTAKKALLAKLMQGKLQNNTIPCRQHSDSIPLSFAQERLWFLEQLDPNQPLYNEPTALCLRGILDVFVLEKSLNEIVRRHESLRTIFTTVEGKAIPIIFPHFNLNLPIVSLELLTPPEQTIEVKRLAIEEASQLFDLSENPLIRVKLLQLSETEYVLLLTMHHIICDRWSFAILLQELTTLYQAFSNGQISPLKELPIQYVDYAIWQKNYLTGEVLEKQRSYWEKQLADAPAVIELPTDYPRPPVMSNRGSQLSFSLSPELTQALKTLSQQEEATLFITLLTAFKVLLYRYTQQTDILVGTTIAGRNREELETLIGFFVNTLVLRTDLSNKPSFRQLLRQVRQVALEAYAHQDLPFEKIVEKLQPERNFSHTALFQVMFQLQNTPNKTLEIPNLTWESLEFHNHTVKFDLCLSMVETEQGLIGNLQYNTDLFDVSTIKRMQGHFQTLLESIITNPEQIIEELALLTKTEQKQFLEWNHTQFEYPQDKCIHQLFEAQVEKTPDAIAVVFENESLTYRQLNERANQLAHYLQKLGVSPEILVGICVERSLEMVIGLLAILKAGGAYVPLDPSYPQERLAFMLENSQVSVLLIQQNLVESLPNHQARVFCLDSNSQAISYESIENPVCHLTPENLAYVIYTSGSTGKPKGAMNRHRAISNRLLWMQDYCKLTAADRVLQKTPFSFDVSVWEFFLPLLTGARLVIAQPDGHKDSNYLVNIITQKQITTVHFVPSMLQVFLEQSGVEECNCIKRVICSGEALSIELKNRFFKHLDAELHNLYGPTEAAVDVTFWKCEKDSILTTTIPIGCPIANTHIYLLDKYLNPVPIGVVGELYIGGVGVGRGYLNSAELTAQKFIPDFFSNELGARLYKTGDLARYLANWNIEFLGRADHQVKVRGFRIEIGEIEAAINQHPEIRETVVIVRENRQDDKRLVAYIVPHCTEISVLELRNFLKSKLPDYMIPSAFVVLEKIPLTPNGKINRRGLPAPDRIQQSEANTSLTLTPVQEILAGIWADILDIKQVGNDNNFFELGGHSLLATRVISQIRKAFQIELPLRCLFESPTVSELAKEIEKATKAELQLNLPTIKPASRSEKIPLSFSQQRLWYLDQLQLNSTAFNIFDAVHIVGLLNISVLEQSLNEIVRRHEILRTNFTVVNGEPIQVIAPSLTLKISIIDISELADNEREHTANKLAQQEAVKPFSLDKESLVRVTLIRLTEADYILLLTMHHIISDGWSTGVLIKELVELYKAFCLGKPSPLPELSIQYADFAIWQNQCFKEELLENQLIYWKQQLKNLPILKLPTDYPRPNIAIYRGAKQTLTLNLTLIAAIKSLSLREGTTIFMTLLAAFKAVLHYYSGQEDIVVGTDVANRNVSETEGLIGFFVNQLVLRTSVSDNPTFSELLQRVRDVTLGAYSHQDLPFDVLVNTLNPERNLNLSPLFQAKFIFDNTQTPTLELPGLTISSIQIPKSSTQLDLILRLTETSQGIIANLEYNTDIFTSVTITQMLEFWVIFLNQVVNNSTTRLQELVGAIAAVDKKQKNLAKIKHKQDTQQKIKTIKRKTINHTS